MDPVPASPPVLRGMRTRRRAMLRSVAAVGSIYKLMCLATPGHTPPLAVQAPPAVLRLAGPRALPAVLRRAAVARRLAPHRRQQLLERSSLPSHSAAPELMVPFANKSRL